MRCHFAKVCQKLPKFALASQGEPRRLRASAATGGLAHAERASNIDMTSAVLDALAHVVVLLLCCRCRRAVRQCERRRRHSRVFVDPGWCPLPWFDPRAGLKGLCACGGRAPPLLTRFLSPRYQPFFISPSPCFVSSSPAQAARARARRRQRAGAWARAARARARPPRLASPRLASPRLASSRSLARARALPSTGLTR